MSEQDRILRQVIKSLTGATVSLEVAKDSGGIPSSGGLYAWWTKQGSIAAVPPCPHPSEEGHLLYIGIAPKDESSKATIRSRVVGNHIRGRTGSSTFRKTLAALLFREMGWRPRFTDRPLLTAADNDSLTDWQHRNLRLTWALHPRPWEVENEIVAALQAPLNLAGNRAHPFWDAVTTARKDFTSFAVSDGKAREKTLPSEVSEPTPVGEQRRSMPAARVKLHDEIEQTLRENSNRWMTTEELARAVVRRKKYVKRDGTSKVTAFQIHGRTKESGGYADIFERAGTRVRLKHP